MPVHVLGALFRGKVLAGLESLRARGLLGGDVDDRAARRRRARLYDTSWVVYAKRPFGGAEQVYRYYAEPPIMLSCGRLGLRRLRDVAEELHIITGPAAKR